MSKMTVSELFTPLSVAKVETIAPALEQQQIDYSAWFHSPNGSIYLKFVPQDMTKEDIHEAFEFAGPINRVDIVNSVPNKTTGSTYRMAFIHFDYWYSTGASLEFRHNIMASFPKECRMHSLVACRELSVTINTRPVPKTNYNVDQLSDMFHRLQEQFTTTVEKQAQEITELKEKVARLEKNQMDTESELWRLSINVEDLDKTVTRVNTDLDEFTAWSDGISLDIEKIESDSTYLHIELGKAANATNSMKRLFTKLSGVISQELDIE